MVFIGFIKVFSVFVWFLVRCGFAGSLRFSLVFTGSWFGFSPVQKRQRRAPNDLRSKSPDSWFLVISFLLSGMFPSAGVNIAETWARNDKWFFCWNFLQTATTAHPAGCPQNSTHTKYQERIYSVFTISDSPFSHQLFAKGEEEQLNGPIETQEERDVWKTFNLAALFLPELNNSMETHEKREVWKTFKLAVLFLPERPDWLVCRSDLRCPSDHTRLVSVFHVPAPRKGPARQHWWRAACDYKTLFWGCFSLVVMAAAGGVSGGRRKLWEISFWVFRRQMGSGENGENRKWWKWREQKKATSWWEKVRKRGKLFREQMRLPRPGKKVLIALFLRHQLGEEVEGAAFDQRILDQRIWEGW